MKKIKLKKKSNFNSKNKLVLVLIAIMFSVFFMISFINKKITPLIFEIVEPEINRISISIINNALARVLENDFSNQELFNTVLSNDGKIQTIDFNSVIVNNLLNVATSAAQNDLRLLELGNFENIGIENVELSQTKIEKLKKGIIMEIPIGIVFHNNLLSNLGPKIPIKLHYTGNIISNIVTKVSAYGINNALVEVGIKMEITAQILLPLTSKKVDLECYIPIAIKVIQGTVPNYYSSGIENQSQIYSLPF